tara:strand:+ start:936 stop:1133 length:198 start_codon:yes stop_codon:yes gene_type:complete
MRSQAIDMMVLEFAAMQPVLPLSIDHGDFLYTLVDLPRVSCHMCTHERFHACVSWKSAKDTRLPA